MALCNPCIRPADSSVITYVQQPSTSLKMLLRRRLFKKSSSLSQTRRPILRSTQKPLQSSGRFQRVQGSNFVREINPVLESTCRNESTANYDMTIFHDDLLDDTRVAMSRRRSKKVPRWAQKSQLQIAFVNQIYFQEKDPEEIFGSIHLDLAHEMVESIEFDNMEQFRGYPSRLPANFV